MVIDPMRVQAIMKPTWLTFNVFPSLVHPSKQGGYAYAPAAGYGHGYVAAYPSMGHGQVPAASYPYSY